jgi:hypothetical protein
MLKCIYSEDKSSPEKIWQTISELNDYITKLKYFVKIETDFLNFIYVSIDDINITRGGRLFESITKILYSNSYKLKEHRFVCDYKPFDLLDIPVPNWLEHEVNNLNKYNPEFKIINGYKYRLWAKAEKEEILAKPKETFYKF